MSNVITLKDVSFSFGGPLILEHIDLEIANGEFIGLVGPNGGGKSTLLKIILGLFKPTSGKVTVMNKPPAKARKIIGYVPQFASFSRDFPVSAEETVLMGRLGKTRLIGRYTANDKKIARQSMQEAATIDIKDRPLATLSGGQLQRVLIARALACEPQILLLDEPTANIDLRAEEDIFDLLKHINERMTIVVVSHDIGFISQYVTRVACLNRTLVCHQGAEITGETIEALYGTHVHMVDHIAK